MIWCGVFLALPTFLIGHSSQLLTIAEHITKFLLPTLALISLPFAIKEKDYYNAILAIAILLAFPITKTLAPFIGLVF